MATNENQAKAIIARYNFQLKGLIESLEQDDKAKASIQMGRVEKVVNEAVTLGVELPPTPDALKEYSPLIDTLAAAQSKAEAKTIQRETAQSKSVAREVAKEKHQTAVKADKAPKAAKPKTDAKLRPCLDGCGAMVKGNFAMGHDAKLKSLLIKIERGDASIDLIPEPCLDLVKVLKGDPIQDRDSAGNAKGDPRDTFRIIAAPVRFPGRDDVTLTHRDD